jgi:hypothetical protein
MGFIFFEISTTANMNIKDAFDELSRKDAMPGEPIAIGDLLAEPKKKGLCCMQTSNLMTDVQSLNICP